MRTCDLRETPVVFSSSPFFKPSTVYSQLAPPNTAPTLQISKFVSIGIAVIALRVLFNNVPGNIQTSNGILWMTMWAFFVCIVISMQGLVRGQIIEAFNLRANTMLTLGRARDADADGTS